MRRLLIVTLAGALVVLAALSLRRPPLPASVNPTPAPPASLSIPEPAPLPLPSVDPIDEVEQRLFDLTNRERARQGLRLLERDAELSAAARLHSEDMLRRHFFAHVNPDREDPADRARRRGRTGAIGENIWTRSGSTAPELSRLLEEALAGWMASSAHRDNILRPGFTSLGVGAAVDGPEVRLTQVFME